jgi:hypothetical protein
MQCERGAANVVCDVKRCDVMLPYDVMNEIAIELRTDSLKRENNFEHKKMIDWKLEHVNMKTQPIRQQATSGNTVGGALLG